LQPDTRARTVPPVSIFDPKPTINVDSVDRIDPRPSDADQVWWRVAVTDGTIPGVVEAWVTDTAAAAIPGDAAEWVAERVKRRARELPGDPPEQLKLLRELSPLRLLVDPLS
jgi:hypothetical protein